MRRPLSILQVNSRDLGGGAEKIAWELFQAYRKRGLSSWLAVGHKQGNSPYVLSIPNDESRGRWAHLWFTLGNLLSPALESIGLNRQKGWIPMIGQPKRSLDILLGREDFHFPGTWKLLDLLPKPPDILHCHNLHGDYFDLNALPRLSHIVPTVVTLHDAWLLTGYCAYFLDCNRWKTGCEECPYLKVYPEIKRDASSYNWKRKRDILATCKLFISTPSQWLMKRVEQSILSPSIVEGRVIPNGIDLSIFKPTSKSEAKKALGLKQETPVLLFVGNRLKKSFFKDYPTIEHTIRYLAQQDHSQELLLLCVGDEGPDETLGKVRISYAGYQKKAKKISSFYQAADIFLHAAKVEAENFPTTVLEAMACGTPVVATAVGGIPEQIEVGKTGLLVPPGDPQSMAQAVGALLSNTPLLEQFGKAAAEEAQRRFNLNRMVDDYLKWYEEILERENKKPEKSCAVQP